MGPLRAGTDSSTPDTAQVTLTYTSSNGTVAPQFYQHRQVTIRSSGDSDFDVTQGAVVGHQTIQKASFKPDPAKLQALMDYIASHHFDPLPLPGRPLRPRPGDGRCSLYLVSPGSSSELGCGGPAAILIDMMNGLLPPTVKEMRNSPPVPNGGIIANSDPRSSDQVGQGVETREIAIKTFDGYFLTAAEGGGFGGVDDGPTALALHSDATNAGRWERFEWIWLDQKQGTFALKTSKGTYLTAVHGGGIGGANNAQSPFHTDSRTRGPDEAFRADFADGTVTLRTRKGFYVTAVGGGGKGGSDDVAIHADATTIGPWETLQAVPAD